MLWADETDGFIKVRDAANTTWLSLDELIGMSATGLELVNAADAAAVLAALGISALPTEINRIADRPVPPAGWVTMGDPRWNRAAGAAEVANTAYWSTGGGGSITTTILATGFDSEGRPFVDVSLVGTASSGSFNCAYVTAASRTAALVGEVWTGSVAIRRLTGSAGTGMRVALVEETAPSTSVQSVFGNSVASTSESISTVSRTIASGDQVRVAVQWVASTGTVLNETYRITALQLERSAARTNGRFAEVSPAEAWLALAQNGAQIGYARASSSAALTLSAAIPFDTTTPQISEGTQVATVTITPKKVGSRLRVTVHCPLVDANGAGVAVTAALFRDGGANAVASGVFHPPSLDYAGGISFDYEFTTTALTAVTFALRIGPNTGSTAYVGQNRFSVTLGGTCSLSLTVQEITH